MNKARLKDRQRFIQEAINSPDDTVKRISKTIRKLKREKRVSRQVELLADILFLSEQTIWRDYSEYCKDE